MTEVTIMSAVNNSVIDAAKIWFGNIWVQGEQNLSYGYQLSDKMGCSF